ncbi:phosphoesterase PA-phosphatase-like protein [Enterobacter roggenkampii]|nr:phosphoesterase PA-phosphatase-like protein [Enterobacter roggenkampii]
MQLENHANELRLFLMLVYPIFIVGSRLHHLKEMNCEAFKFAPCALAVFLSVAAVHNVMRFGAKNFAALHWRERPRLAWSFVVLGILLGLAMGFGQVMRGAHFFSHNLWAGWWVWFSQVAVYGLVSTRFAKE